MKTKLFKCTFLFTFMMVSFTTFSQENNSVLPLKGSWIFSVADAPYGYQNGSIEFKYVNEKLTAEAKIGNNLYAITDISKKNDHYTFNIYVDGSDVKVKLKTGTDNITGTVFAEGWEMPVKLSKNKK